MLINEFRIIFLLIFSFFERYARAHPSKKGGANHRLIVREPYHAKKLTMM